MEKTDKGGRPRTHPKAPAFDRAVGKRIRERRESLDPKMTQQALAVAVNRAPSQIYRYESGDVTVSGPMLAKIAAAVRCEVSDLVAGIKVPK